MKFDGDKIRRGINADIGAKPTVDVSDDENLRRVIELCHLVADSDVVAICSFVSPYRDWRKHVREKHQAKNVPFFDVISFLYTNTQ